MFYGTISFIDNVRKSLWNSAQVGAQISLPYLYDMVHVPCDHWSVSCQGHNFPPFAREIQFESIRHVVDQYSTISFKDRSSAIVDIVSHLAQSYERHISSQS